MQRRALIIVVAALVTLGGCAVLNPSDTHPVLKQTWGPNAPDDVGEAIAIKADRRVVIVLLRPQGGKGEWARFCAEPSPDVAQNLTNTFAAALEASGSGTGQRGPIEAQASAEITRNLAATAREVFNRSQGVQLARDGMFGLCQMFLNGAISAAAVPAAYQDLLRESSALIKLELEKRTLWERAPEQVAPTVPKPAASKQN